MKLHEEPKERVLKGQIWTPAHGLQSVEEYEKYDAEESERAPIRRYSDETKEID